MTPAGTRHGQRMLAGNAAAEAARRVGQKRVREQQGARGDLARACCTVSKVACATSTMMPRQLQPRHRVGADRRQPRMHGIFGLDVAQLVDAEMHELEQAARAGGRATRRGAARCLRARRRLRSRAARPASVPLVSARHPRARESAATRRGRSPARWWQSGSSHCHTKPQARRCPRRGCGRCRDFSSRRSEVATHQPRRSYRPVADRPRSSRVAKRGCENRR